MTSGEDTGRVRLDREGQRLVEKHLWLADVIAREMAWLAPKTVDGDVVGPARVGLVNAVLRLDPARRDAFVGYARKWIAGAIFDAVDRRHPGSAAPHRAALEAHDEAEEGRWSGEGGGRDADGDGDGDSKVAAEDPLHHAAAALGVSSASARWARQDTSNELCRILMEELARYPLVERHMFVARMLEDAEWDDVAKEGGVSVSTAKRCVAAMRGRILARLRGRGVGDVGG